MESLADQAVVAFLGLGSNIGDRASHLGQALRSLASAGNIVIRRASSIYETAPWGFTEQPKFLNCVVEIETVLSPSQLLDSVKVIENKMGRVPTVRYGPRPIDIDILLYGDLVIDWDTPDLKIPHVSMVHRAFVLVPLAEIAGHLQHPTAGVSISELSKRTGQEGVEYWDEMTR